MTSESDLKEGGGYHPWQRDQGVELALQTAPGPPEPQAGLPCRGARPSGSRIPALASFLRGRANVGGVWVRLRVMYCQDQEL